MSFSLSRRLAAEAVGTAFLVATVVGAGIMATRLTDDVALALLANGLSAGAILIVLITLLGPVSGAQFNPAVTLALLMRREIAAPVAAAYAAAQVAGGVTGSLIAHAMFELPVLQVSQTVRGGAGQWLAEIVASFGLIATILIALRLRRETLPMLVGLYISAAYWFTASTSFANPAVAIARAFTDTFAGIRPADLPGFLIAEAAGAALAVLATGWLLTPDRRTAPART